LVERGFAQKPPFPSSGQSFVLPMAAKDEVDHVRSPRAELPDERLAKEVKAARAYLFPQQVRAGGEAVKRDCSLRIVLNLFLHLEHCAC
jgi:hypothetical protein